MSQEEEGLPVTRPELGKGPAKLIEDYPAGYPQLTALISSHPSFQVYRRFSGLRARLLLYKQDSISILEERLEKLDAEETQKLFLGSSRRDKNEARKQLLREVDTALTEYDALLSRNKSTLAISHAKKRDINNLQSWLKESGSVARSETAYLWKNDLMAAGAIEPDAIYNALEGSIEDIIILGLRLLKMKFMSSISTNPSVYILPECLVGPLTRLAVALMPILILAIPLVILFRLDGLDSRLATILIAQAVFTISLSTFAQLRTADLFIASATYAAVLVVFISGTGSP